MRVLGCCSTMVLATLGGLSAANATPPPLVAVSWDFVDGDGASDSDAVITVENRSQRTVDAFDATIRFFDAFRRPVRNRFFLQCQVWRRINKALRCNGTNTLQVSYDNGTEIGPSSSADGLWGATGWDVATRASITITAVHFTDGRVWRGRASTPILEAGEVEDGSGPEPPRAEVCDPCRARGGTCVTLREDGKVVGYRCDEAAPATTPCQHVVDGNCVDEASPLPTAPQGPPAPAPAPPPATPSRDDVAAAMNAVAPAVRSCAGGRGGVVEFQLVFSASGAVDSASVRSGPLATGAQGECMVRAVRQARVPPFTSPRLSITFPILIR